MIELLAKGRAYMRGGGLGPMLVRNVAGTGIVRVASMAASFLVGVQLARMLGVEGYGYYGLALSILTLAGIPGELGMSRLVTREVAGAAACDDMPSLFGVLRWAWITALLLSLVMAAVAFGAAYVVTVDRPSTLAWAIMIGAPVIPLMTLSRIEGGAMQGLHQVVRGQIPANLFRPAILSLLLFLWALSGTPFGVAGAMVLSSVTALAAFMLATWWLRRLLPANRPAQYARPAGKRLFASAIPIALADGMRSLQAELTILLVGVFAVPAQVGLLRVAMTVATTAAIAMPIVAQVAAPTIARLYAKHEMGQLQALATHSARVQFAGVCAVSLPLALLAGPLLGLVFGADYAAAANPLRVILLGQVVNSAFGVNAPLLVMTRHEGRVTRAMGFGLVINAAMLLLLTRSLGALGAAFAFTIGLIAWNVITWADGRRFLGIECSIFGTARAGAVS